MMVLLQLYNKIYIVYLPILYRSTSEEVEPFSFFDVTGGNTFNFRGTSVCVCVCLYVCIMHLFLCMYIYVVKCRLYMHVYMRISKFIHRIIVVISLYSLKKFSNWCNQNIEYLVLQVLCMYAISLHGLQRQPSPQCQGLY